MLFTSLGNTLGKRIKRNCRKTSRGSRQRRARTVSQSGFWPKIELWCYNTHTPHFYSTDLVQCDFWLFLKLKRTHFESVEALTTKSCKSLQKNDFLHRFNQWKIRIAAMQFTQTGAYRREKMLNNQKFLMKSFYI